MTVSRISRTLVLAASAVAALPLVSLIPATGAVAGTSTPVNPAGTYSISGSPATLAAINRYVTGHPGSFAGIWADRGRPVLNVATAPGAQAQIVGGLYAAARAGAPVGTSSGSWSLQLSHAAYSLASLQQTMNSVTTAQPWTALSAPYLAAWGISNSGDRVVIGLTRITAPVRRAAAESFGNKASLTVMQRPQAEVYQHKLRSTPRLVKVHSLEAVRPDTCSRFLDCIPRGGG
jgi:hypothetical protein